jgi:hypothetical protein
MGIDNKFQPGQAPRVMRDDIEAAISSEHYFTADAGVVGERYFSADSEAAMVNLDAGLPDALRRLTFCVLVLKNGAFVTGESASASMAYFDAEKVRLAARDRAIIKAWDLMGFALVDRLHREGASVPCGSPVEFTGDLTVNGVLIVPGDGQA